MNEWLHNLPVWQMALVVFVTTYLAAGEILVIITVLAKGVWSPSNKYPLACCLPWELFSA